MPSLTLVLPFALPPQAHARDLIAQLRLPALARLLSRAARTARHAPSEHASLHACLPHEQWLTRQTSDTSPPMAHQLMHKLGLSAAAGHWFVLQPVHLHVARDHLVLTDYRQLQLDDSTARTLFDAIRPLFADQQIELLYGNSRYWFMRADHWVELRTCTPDAACGHNIDIWQPSGATARDWRRLHNEVQMLWHQHPINEEREARSEQRVNALWLWGASSGTESGDGLRVLSDALLQSGHTRMTETEHTDESVRLRLDTSLLPLALADDWSGWLQQMQQMEEQWFAPMLAALSSGKLDQLTLVLSDSQRLDLWTARRSSMRKFWVSPSLSRLAS